LGLITKETYTIEKLKPGSGLPREEQELLNHMFGSGSDSFEITGSYDPSVQSMASAFRGKLRDQWGGFISKGNNWKFWLLAFFTLIVGVIALLVLHASFDGDYDLLFFGGFVAANLILFFTYARLIRKPSIEKLALRAKLKGFKMYLSTAE